MREKLKKLFYMYFPRFMTDQVYFVWEDEYKTSMQPIGHCHSLRDKSDGRALVRVFNFFGLAVNRRIIGIKEYD